MSSTNPRAFALHKSQAFGFDDGWDSGAAAISTDAAPTADADDGLVLLDRKNHPVKDWPGLNKTLSTEIESWRWEALTRVYPWLTVAEEGAPGLWHGQEQEESSPADCTGLGAEQSEEDLVLLFATTGDQGLSSATSKSGNPIRQHGNSEPKTWWVCT